MTGAEAVTLLTERVQLLIRNNPLFATTEAKMFLDALADITTDLEG